MRGNLGAALFQIAIGIFAAAVFTAKGEPRRAFAPADASNPLKYLIPGEEFLPPSVAAQQADDFDNPAFALVESGEKAWSAPEGTLGKSCRSCHGTGDRNGVRRAAASYPKYLPGLKEVITLPARINLCRKTNLGADVLAEDSAPMLAMTAYLRWLARGNPETVDKTGPAAELFERGRALYQTKQGLLQLSCAQCHHERFGQKFGGDTLSQGHPVAYPAYKLDQQRVITLHERFRMCNALVRGKGQPDGSDDYIALELFLNWRSRNLPVTAPGVRP
ncbi:sulfur oxidation c-type cytochrome SoxA [Rhodomicrobium lacus]|uniref:sulfur oxidation c-type cytochrome SoxA n=1 Tax=Rhodomicrobium lacus TaxID=2498452 RepID=UPI0013DE97D4|nr:sulfur oxidation c-type cytochrome SoxA [Rhodomicrobium lacus]